MAGIFENTSCRPVCLNRISMLLLITSLSPRSPQAQGASLKADDSHSGQPHNEGCGTKSVGEAQ